VTAGARTLRRVQTRVWFALLAVMLGAGSAMRIARADSPELAMRDFASGQIKKGVRSIGFGGDGATWGNYGLVWRDAGTALADYGDTSYSNGNEFRFVALGATTPPLWQGLTVYLIGLSETTNAVAFDLHSPGLGPGPQPVVGTGANNALFSKIAMPLGNGVSAGVLISYERSHFSAASDTDPANTVRYDTFWRPSGGFGVAWQPTKRLLFGFRALINADLERRTDATGTVEGIARSAELRLGGSLSPWQGALIDVGGTRLEKQNAIAGSRTTTYHPNLGFEQAFAERRFVVRFGVDETSPTAGISAKFSPVNIDIAYVRNMARARVGELFGDGSNSVVATVTVDYRAFHMGR
jgi:hypothetical protein